MQVKPTSGRETKGERDQMVTYELDSIDVSSVINELTEKRESADTLSSEIQERVEEMERVKSSIEDAVNEIEDYVSALEGIQSSLSALQDASEEAEDWGF
tara:strand:+ start:3132 stop:3431 length:300 start_codon:yes stop_codon:yes gene_type:complete